MVRLLATLRLDPKTMGLIIDFMEAYLKLSPREELAFQHEVDKLESNEERKAVMHLMTSWERKGRAIGREEGREEGRQEGRHEERLALVSRQLERKLGPLGTTTARQLRRLPDEHLMRLAEALLFFTTIGDLRQWLARNAR